MTNQHLLHRYRSDRSEAAFATLVQRYVDLVYSTAVRQVHSPDFAKEVSQQVFLELAASVHHLRPDTHLASWLYVVTRRRAIDLIRRENRRMKHEMTAAAQGAIATDDGAIWAKLGPLLDDVLDELKGGEREAVVRRFFENEDFRHIGAAMGISEDAAQKRVSRALDRLRALLVKRGITAAPVALALTLSARAVEPAPAGLSASITHAAAHSIGVSTPPAAALHKIIAAVGRKPLLVATVAALGGFLYFSYVEQSQQAEIETLRAESTRLTAAIQNERARQATAARARPVMATPPADPLEAKARALAGRIRRLHDWIDLVPEDALPRAGLLTDTDWILAVDNKPELDDYDSSIYAQTRVVEDTIYQLDGITTNRFDPTLVEAVQRFRRATGKPMPNNVRDLLPFFAKPIDPSFLRGYSIDPPSGISYWHSGIQHGTGFGGSFPLPPE